ncbi:hypothetical protein, partial [Marilutibacter penaei]|uniref:hypothetical protein n=1 Tax=Marilutibacter penaei TaxID=2759900 RepID=UPI001C72863F
PASASRRKPMICSSEKRFFTSNLLLLGDWTPNRRATQRRGGVAPCPIRQGYGLGFEVAHFAEGSALGHGGSDWAEDTLAYLDQPSGDGLIILLNAPNPRGTRAMADLIALLDPDSPYLPRYRAR